MDQEQRIRLCSFSSNSRFRIQPQERQPWNVGRVLCDGWQRHPQLHNGRSWQGQSGTT